MSERALFDPGLQPERTELAWRRTALGIAVGSLVALRLLPAVFQNPWWVLPGLVGIGFGAALWMLSRSRFRRANDVLLRERELSALPGAGLLLSLCAFTVVTGAFGIALAVALASSG